MSGFAQTHWPTFDSEEDVRSAGFVALNGFCQQVEHEYEIPGHRLRVDLCGHLPNGDWALVECKRFTPFNLSPFVDAIDQAASYADAIQYPVFIGPVYGSPSDFSAGRLNNALGALHLLGSRLNVGFLWVNHLGEAGLMLRGQSVVRTSPQGVLQHDNFSSIWRYTRRFGSKKT